MLYWKKEISGRCLPRFFSFAIMIFYPMKTQAKIQKHGAANRIHWIDICRGIGIILVLYGHLFVSDKNNYLIFAFHMPLFFFISGLVFKTVTNKSLLSLAFKFAKQLLIPYYIFAVMTYLFTFVSQAVSQTGGNISLSSIGYQLFGILYGSGSDGMLGYNVVLWFLPCLFITKLTFALITKITTQTKKLFLILFGCGLSGYLISLFFPWLKLPFGFEIALTGLVFFGAGFLFQKHKNQLVIFSNQKALLSITALLFTILIATINYHSSGSKVDLRSNQLDNFFLFYLGAFGGITGWVAVSKLLVKNAFLEYLGRHSIVIFAWHNVLLSDIKPLINSLFSQDMINSITLFMPTLYAAAAISIILFSRMVLVKLKGVAARTF